MLNRVNRIEFGGMGMKIRKWEMSLKKKKINYRPWGKREMRQYGRVSPKESRSYDNNTCDAGNLMTQLCKEELCIYSSFYIL